jgi:hypothetical protein
MRDFEDIERYRTMLIGKTVESVRFSSADEGLVIRFTDGTTLDFGFGGCEGQFQITKSENAHADLSAASAGTVGGVVRNSESTKGGEA